MNFFFWINLINFWHLKLTLKVQFLHFFTNCHYSEDIFKEVSLVACWFLAKKLAFKDRPSLKFHERTDISGYAPASVKKKRFCLNNYLKVRQSRNDFFQADVSSKKWTNEFYFTTIKPQVDLFSFFFFLEEIEDTKKTFINQLTFRT